ncbi:hypothetical protein BC938DRAFT_471220 [Jimgerdemannia flammicorona]|uniref:Uncharacterized protein n=1 Tax=Jimgerdemannia flammicorona TaxID=994334 RepID=A0A433QUN7_9FUNG|nr:hypothetical protein BC938DRAFT_471220 [Jimgerdemannia flammicorona]
MLGSARATTILMKFLTESKSEMEGYRECSVKELNYGLFRLEEIERGEDEDEAEAEAGGIEDDDSSDVEPEKDEDTNVEGDNAKEKDQNRFEVAFSLSSNEDFVYPIDDDQSLTEVAVKCRLPKRQRRPLETISVTASAPAEMPGTKELSEPVYADDNNGDGGDEVISVEINSIMEDLRREPLHEICSEAKYCSPFI